MESVSLDSMNVAILITSFPQYNEPHSKIILASFPRIIDLVARRLKVFVP